MPPRFFAPDVRAAGDRVRLPEGEGEHLARVLRLGRGALVRVFNGLGGEFDAEVVEASRGAVAVHVVTVREAIRECRVAVTIAQAVLKGEKMDEVVRDVVMMGVAAVQPVVSDRSEVSATTLRHARRRERWQRIAVASAKQSGRAVVPVILEACPLDALATALETHRLPSPAVMFVEPAAAGRACPLGDIDEIAPAAATVVVGPEGGWTAEEIERQARTCRLVTLGPRTLRADAVPVIALAALFARWGEF
jgi:16S rRNA (uracil1498-N3)-methyltransferase